MKKEKNFILEKRLNYPQPHNIRVSSFSEYNPALAQRSVEYLHSRAKYLEKYKKSKQTKRMYSAPDYL